MAKYWRLSFMMTVKNFLNVKKIHGVIISPFKCHGTSHIQSEKLGLTVNVRVYFHASQKSNLLDYDEVVK